jgi:hypothetical protein
VTKVRVAVEGQPVITLPVPDGIVIVPRASSPAPRRVGIQP